MGYYLSSVIIFLWSCGSPSGKTELASATYRLDREATNKKSNNLTLTLSQTDGYSFSIAGDHFDASIPIGSAQSIRDQVKLTYTDAGYYQMTLKVYQSDGAPIIADTLVWQYSEEIPPDPLVTFSEEATNDQDVNLLVQVNVGENVKELWVEGDVTDAYNKKWNKIPSNLTVPIKVTAADGMKKMTVKYRNIFGTESSTASLQILKKSVKPTNCSITTNTTITESGSVVVSLSATNEGSLYYLISGDIAKQKNTWTQFTSQISETIAIANLEKVNVLTVKLRDVASNYCPDQKFSITYNPNHAPLSIEVENNPLWTDDPSVNVLLHLDYNPSDTVLMYIHGNVEIASNTFAWIPYSSRANVTLSPIDGTRNIRIQYKLNGKETIVKTASIFLKPFIYSAGGSAPYTLTLSEIIGLTSMTITGCSEISGDIAPTPTVNCTPTGAVSVRYNLSDGTSVTKTKTVP